MSEEIQETQTPEVSEGQPQESVNFDEILKQKDSEIDNLKKIAQGQDKKNSELFKKIESLEKIINEKDNSKKTVEQQLQEMQQLITERDAREKQKEKEAIVHKIIAENKLDPTFDFDFLYKFETEEAIKENAQKRAEYYNKIKEDGFRERVSGSEPTRGERIDSNNLKDKSFFELNKIVKNDPKMEEAVLKEIDRRTKNG